MGLHSQAITGVIRDILARHFGNPDNIEIPALQRYVWQPGDRTAIQIESLNRWHGQLASFRPALIIKFNGQQNQRITIGDQAGYDEHGQLLYNTLWHGSHTVFCLATAGAAAELLSVEVRRELHNWHPVIVPSLQILRWQVAEIGQTGQLEEANDTWVVPVTVHWTFQDTWKVSLESLKLLKVPIQFIVNGNELV